MTNSYYEVHITMTGSSLIIEKAVKDASWSFSRIDGDPVEGAGVKCYATKHFNASIEADLIIFNLNSLADSFAAIPGITVTRRKVELVIYDTKSSKVRPVG